MDARGKFGERERCVRVARGDSRGQLWGKHAHYVININRPFKDRDGRFHFPFLPVKPYLFILKSDKGTPFGWSPPVLAIFASTPSLPLWIKNKKLLNFLYFF